MIKSKKILTPIIHVLSWLLIFSIPIIFFKKPETEMIWFFHFKFLIFVSLFYINYNLLIPKFLSKEKLLWWTSSIIICLIIIVFINRIIINSYFSEKYSMSEHSPENIIGIIFMSIFILAVSTSIRVTQAWYANEKQKNIIKSEKLHSELSFLKSQINPHFLFNTLNNIYSLANRKSEHTATAIVKLSNLMRYMIYDTKKEKVELRYEINYLIDYIELQKLRIPDKSKVEFNIEGNSSDKEIEPMLLIPFVENAFKHGDICSDNAKINILLNVNDKRLIFKVKNNIGESEKENKDAASGIGLENTEKRLKLLYPNKHEFFTKSEDKIFISYMRLNLDK